MYPWVYITLLSIDISMINTIYVKEKYVHNYPKDVL